MAYLSNQTAVAGFANRHDGVYFLVAGVTMFNDPNKNTLHGGSGSDWRFADAADKITGLTNSADLTLFL